MNQTILAINPGGTSTKVSLFEGEKELWSATARHSPDELARFGAAWEQHDLRREVLRRELRRRKVKLSEIGSFAGRGGPFKPLPGGTYRVNEAMLDDIRAGRLQADHPSALGALLADDLAREAGGAAYIVDPVSVDEMVDEARLSGLAGLPRRSLSHALNSRYVAKKVCREAGVDYAGTRLVIAHLGSGTTVSAHRDGRMIDVNNAMDGGPMATQRTGGLPLTGLIELCFSGECTAKQLIDRCTRSGGLVSHTGTDMIPEIRQRAENGDRQAALALKSYVYQTAKEIGAMGVAAGLPLRFVVITGGAACNACVVDPLREMVSPLADSVAVVPGEGEMAALADGVLRVLRGEEDVREYR